LNAAESDGPSGGLRRGSGNKNRRVLNSKKTDCQEKLKKIARALGIKIGSETWREMKDMANIDAGIIPDDIRSNGEVLKALPMFFRTIRSDKPTVEELDKLIDMIKKEG